jgi:ketosteroid isomerase-like protein
MPKPDIARVRFTFLSVVLATSGCVAGSDRTGEAASEIHALEQQQVVAAIARDRASLEAVFAPDFRIVNPAGGIADRDELLKLLTEGAPAYSSARFEPQLLRDYGDTVVTVGTETVVMAGGPQAGQAVRRRITHVWRRDAGRWRLTLRHATIVVP